MPGESEYVRALLRARARGHGLTRAAVRRVNLSLRDALRDLPAGTSGPITAAQADALRKRLHGVLNGLSAATEAGVRRGKLLTVREVVKIHADVNVKLYRANDLPVKGVTEMFSNVQVRAVAAIASRPTNAATFRTLINRHMQDAAPDLDRLLTKSIATGVSSAKLARDVEDILRGEFPSLQDYELRVNDLSGLRTVASDARRIAVSETNNALREANVMAMQASPIVQAARWQRSGNEDEDCEECAYLAEADEFGHGEGYWPVDEFPTAPHPNCTCYPGDVIFTPVEEWPEEPEEPELVA